MLLTEEEDLSSEVAAIGTSLEVSSAGGVARAESLRDASPVKEYLGRSFGKRSSSLDSNGTPVVDPLPTKPSESGGILSRLTKTFEDKINEIRKEKESSKHDKYKEKVVGGEVASEGEGGSGGSDKSPTQKENKDKKPVDIVQKTVDEEKSSKTELTGSPPKTKTSIVQDITEHTSKIKSELGSIRPKLSELRNRRSSSGSKDSAKSSKESAKNKSFPFTSLLGRDEGLEEEMLLECDESEVDRAVEAHEDSSAFHEDLPVVDGEEASTENDQELVTNQSKSPSPESSPKKKSPPLVEVKETKDLTPKEQLLQLVNKLPVSMSVLTKVLLTLFCVCFVLPIPRFVAGALFGFVVSGLMFYCLLQFLLPSAPELPPVDDGPVLLSLPTYEDQKVYKVCIFDS